jgi:uncharacterized membrane protein
MAMTASNPDRLVVDYLRRLEAAAAALPAQRRAELLAEIGAHIDDALSDAGATDEVTVRNVLERLGTPEEIALAATGSSTAPRRTPGKLEIAALIALAVGGVLPILGWAIGVVLVMASDLWSRRDKIVALLLGLLPALTLLLVLLVSARSNSNTTVEETGGGLGPFELLILGWGFVSGLPSAAYLAYRLRHERPPTRRGGTLTPSIAGD